MTERTSKANYFSKLYSRIAMVIPTKFKSIVKVFVESLVSWIDHRASSKGAALAFYTLFSLAPILVLAVAVAGYFFGVEAAQGRMISEIRYLVGQNGTNAVQAILATARDPVAGVWATALASLLLLIGATSVFTELKGSLDELWGVEKSKLSPVGVLLRTRLISFSLVMALAFLLLISLVISAALSMFENYAGVVLSSSGSIFSVLSTLISFGVITSLFAVIYKMLPDAPLSWHDVSMGAIFTAGLFILGKYLIGLYLGNSDVASGFGAAGSIIALLLWVYYSAQIFFLGAEFTRQYALSFGSLQHKKEQQLALDKVQAKPLAAIEIKTKV